MANSPIVAVCSGSMLLASILNLSVMIGNYLQQTTSARQLFQLHFFRDSLRVKTFILKKKNLQITKKYAKLLYLYTKFESTA